MKPALEQFDKLINFNLWDKYIQRLLLSAVRNIMITVFHGNVDKLWSNDCASEKIISFSVLQFIFTTTIHPMTHEHLVKISQGSPLKGPSARPMAKKNQAGFLPEDIFRVLKYSTVIYAYFSVKSDMMNNLWYLLLSFRPKYDFLQKI